MSYNVARGYEEQTNNVDNAKADWQTIVQNRGTPDEVAAALHVYKHAVHGLLTIIPLKHNVSEAILGQFYTDNITSLTQYYNDFYAMRPDMAKLIQSTITSLERELAELRNREAAAAAAAAAEAVRQQELEAAYQHRDALEAELARIREAWHAHRAAEAEAAAAAEAEAAAAAEAEAARQHRAELEAAYKHRAELEARLEAVTQRMAAAQAAADAEAQALADRLARRHPRDHFEDDADAQELIIHFGCFRVTKRQRME